MPLPFPERPLLLPVLLLSLLPLLLLLEPLLLLLPEPLLPPEDDEGVGERRRPRGGRRPGLPQRPFRSTVFY